MYLLYCDETNFQKNPGDFFLYGGIAIDAAVAGDLAAEIGTIRTAQGVPRDYILKFNPGPQEFSHAQFIELKRTVMAAAVQYQCKLFINLVLHDIATSSEEARRFGINRLCYHFDCYLNRPKTCGLVLIDRFADQQIDGQLKEKLSVGLTGPLPYSKELRLERIVGYHLAAIGQSHFCSLVDVILGSLRFAINAFTQGNEAHLDTARSILQLLAPLFFRENGTRVHEISLCLSPQRILIAAYREKYQNLRAFLAQNGIVSFEEFATNTIDSCPPDF